MDDLERRLRAANPVTVRRGAPLTPRAERELRVLLGQAPPRRSRGRAWNAPAGMLAVAAVVLALLAVVIPVSLVPQPAAAVAPPALEIIPTEEDALVVLARLSSVARATKGAPSSSRIESETWSADVTVAQSKWATHVQPREVTRTRAADLSGAIVVRAGEVRWGVPPAGSDIAEPGAELEHYEYPAGEFPLLFPQAPPTTADALQRYLDTALGADALMTTGDYFAAVQDLRTEWVLSGPQTAAILDILASRHDVTVLGGVSDRLGRAGIAIATETRMGGAFRDLLIFDADTGALLAGEESYIGAIDGVQIEPETVLSYTAWKETR
ncbi:CU044_5270 family protein [Microbacterium aurum]